MKRQALLMVLSGKFNDEEIIFLDDLKLGQPKTNEAAKIIEKLSQGLKKDLSKGALLVLSQKDENILRATKNIKRISLIGAASLNVIDLLEKKYLLITKESVDVILKTYLKD
jgi:large subunit ribosomal protein L4